MSDLQFTYERILKIPARDFSEGLTHKAEIDGQIRESLKGLSADSKGSVCRMDGDNGDHLAATLKCGDQSISISGRYGQNTIFVNGRSASFFSYSIRAESTSASIDRMNAAGDRLIVMGKIIGGLAAPALLAWPFFAFANKTGLLIIWILPFVLAVSAGIWCGGRIGERLAVRLENRAHNRTVDTGAADAAVSVWTRLRADLEQISEKYERM